VGILGAKGNAAKLRKTKNRLTTKNAKKKKGILIPTLRDLRSEKFFILQHGTMKPVEVTL